MSPQFKRFIYFLPLKVERSLFLFGKFLVLGRNFHQNTRRRKARTTNIARANQIKTYNYYNLIKNLICDFLFSRVKQQWAVETTLNLAEGILF